MSAVPTLEPPVAERVVPAPRVLRDVPTTGDRVFRGSVRVAAFSVLLTMGLIGLYLAIGAWPAFEVAGWGFLSESQWLPETGSFGIASLLWGTILVALIALAVAVPVGLGAAIFISEYAPLRLRRMLITVVDLMAAVPSIIFGMWGFFLLQEQLLQVAKWLSDRLGSLIPFFRVDDPTTLSSFTSSAFIAGLVVGVVVMPTITSVTREVFSQAPIGEREGAIALGATRWGVVRHVVLPFGRSGMVGGVMLGLGRALGETIVVFLIISPLFTFTTQPLQSGTNTIAAHIAARYSESSGIALAGLLGAGLVLFLFTLVINTLAGVVVSRSRSGASTGASSAVTTTEIRPATAAPRAVPHARTLARIRSEDVVPLVSAALGAIGLVWVAFERLLPFSGTVGFWLLTYVVFLVLYRIVLGTLHDKVIVRDRLMAAIFATAGLVMAAALGSVLLFTLVRGWEAVSHANFFTETTAFIGPDAPLDSGGIYAAMIGTLQQIGLATLISVPLGLATAVYLNEVGGRMSRTVRTVVEAMSAIPTIVAGLFVYSIAILTFGFERSGFAAALALTVGMLPVVTTTAEVVLRLVPNGLREASLALGTSKWRTVRGVVLPTARPGLVTAVLLGVARVVGETSPVLLVAGLTSELNYNAFSGPQLSLPLFVFNQVRYPLDAAIARAFGAAVVLLLVVVVLFALARIIGGRPVGAPPRRLWRRRPQTDAAA